MAPLCRAAPRPRRTNRDRCGPLGHACCACSGGGWGAGRGGFERSPQRDEGGEEGGGPGEGGLAPSCLGTGVTIVSRPGRLAPAPPDFRLPSCRSSRLLGRGVARPDRSLGGDATAGALLLAVASWPRSPRTNVDALSAAARSRCPFDLQKSGTDDWRRRQSHRTRCCPFAHEGHQGRRWIGARRHVTGDETGPSRVWKCRGSHF